MALIRLKKDLELGPIIRKVCLPLEAEATPEKWFGQSVFLAGYGAPRNENTNPLKTARLDVISNAKCIKQLVSLRNFPNIVSKIHLR